MKMIHLVISFLGGAGMAANFGVKVWPWEIQKKIQLSFLDCAIVWHLSVFVLLFDSVILLACMGPWRLPGRYGAYI